MAWSAKLQSEPGGVPGYNEFELVYNPSTQTTFKLQYNFKVGGQEADVLYHTPDNGHPTPIRVTNRPVLIFLTQDVYGDDWDDIFTQIDNIKRLVHGEFSQAVRSLTGGAPSVRVAILPDGASLTTYYKVMVGHVDASESYYKPVAVINKIARGVVIALTCEPAGYGDSFTLSNSLVSSPHFIVDTDADGLADGWADYGTPTETVLSTLYLVGGYSQKVTADSGSGIASTVVTASTSTDLVGYVWVYSSAMSGFQMSLRDGSNNAIESVTCTAANADKTAIDSGGRTWYRFTANGQNTTAANARLSITSTAAGKVFYVDACYLTTGTQTAPPAFSGAKTLTNNGINHLDFWGIPGDVPALINMSLTSTGTNDEGFIFGRRTDGKQLANAIRYRIESPTFAGGVFSVSSNYIRASSTGASDFYFANADNITPADDPAATARAIGDTIFKLYVVARSSATANTLYGQYSANGSTMIDTDTASATTADTWELWDLGIVNPTGLVVNTSGTSSFYLQFQATVTGTLDIDYAILLPVGDEYLIVDGSPRNIYGTLKQITYSVGYTASFLSTWRGSMWQIPAGPQMTRLVYHDFGASNAVTVGNTLAISATITPRTSHLLGVS